MDWLRIFAFGLLAIYHICLFFIPWNWHVTRAETSLILVAPVIAMNPWRLLLLFVVAGYASAALIRKYRDPLGFAKERCDRLVLPVLFGIAVLLPVQPWIEILVNDGYRGNFWQFYREEYWSFSSRWGFFLPNWLHLWFVVYLWGYSLLIALCWWLVPASWFKSVLRGFDRLLAGWRMLLLPALFLMACMLWSGIDAVRLDSWVRYWPAQPVYFGSMLFGLYLFHTQRGWTAIRQYWPVAAVAAVGLTALAIAIRLGWDEASQPTSITTIFALSRPLQAWTAIIALLGIADRYGNVDHRWRAGLADAVFPFYVIHKSIIVITAYLLLAHPIAIPVEFAILLIVTLIGSWAYYRLCRAVPWLRPLAGMKR